MLFLLQVDKVNFVVFCKLLRSRVTRKTIIYYIRITLFSEEIYVCKVDKSVILGSKMQFLTSTGERLQKIKDARALSYFT